jgi:branched-chain amino acid transport system permease protein
VLVVMFSPGGVAGWLMLHVPVWRSGQLGRLVPSYAMAAGPGAIVFLGAVGLIELAHRQLTVDNGGGPLHMLGLTLDSAEPAAWIGALAFLAGGALLLRMAWSRVTEAWAGLRATAPELKDGAAQPTEVSA